MAKIDFLTAKMNKSRNLSIDFFDNLAGPPVGLFFRPDEVEYIKYIITHNRNDIKINTLNAIMKSKGFSRLSGGTNRMVYRHLDDTSFVLKVALDRVGLGDNLAEFKNQQRLKPYVCKIFDTTPCGTMATIERVMPITSKEEFIAVQEEIFYLIVTKIIGKYVAEDIGRNYFRNFGIRPMFGPVLLDYPYIYPLAEEKLFCTHRDPLTNIRCTGMIDYDDGFNHLFCRKCGTRYLALDLEDKNATNDIIKRKGGIPMNVDVYMNGKKYSTVASSNVITNRITKNTPKKPTKLKVTVTGIPKKDIEEEAIDNQVNQIINPDDNDKFNDNKNNIDIKAVIDTDCHGDDENNNLNTIEDVVDTKINSNENNIDKVIEVSANEEAEITNNDNSDEESEDEVNKTDEKEQLTENNEDSHYTLTANGSWVDNRTGRFVKKEQVPESVINKSYSNKTNSKAVKAGTSIKSKKGFKPSRVYSSPGASVEE